MKLGDIIKSLVTLFTFIAAIFGLYQWLNQHINGMIDAKISNPSFLKELARSTRPSVVFDEKDSIIADIGAMAYLEDIAVTKLDKERIKIIVTPKDFIGTEPVLEPLDDSYTIKAERGTGYDWIFQLNSMNIMTMGAPKERRLQRFRLEVILTN